MSLQIGTVNAESGMTQLIYDQLNAYLSPPLQDAVDSAEGDAKAAAQEALTAAREGWKKLAHAVATGVVTHIVDALELSDIQARGGSGDTVTSASALSGGNAHSHDVNLNGVTFDQVAGSGAVS